MRFAVLVLLVLFTTVVAHAQRVLTGVEWQLVSLGPTGAEQNIVPGTTVTLRLGDDGRAGGSTGCNSYGGSYQVRGDTISFGRIVATRRACLDQNANQQEHRFLTVLETANRFRLSSYRLTIISDRSRSVLNFVDNSAPDPDDPDARPPRDDREIRWRIYRADISTMPAGARVSRMLSQCCNNSQ